MGVETESQYMMARAWIHNHTEFKRRLFDDSNPNLYDLCYVVEKVGNPYAGWFWRGGWVFGVGFIDVYFPVEDTRPATDREKDELCGGLVGSSFAGSWKLDRARFA